MIVHREKMESCGEAARRPVPGVPAASARIGPNAIIRMGEALVALEGKAGAAAVFEAAGVKRYLETPPADMVPESDVAALTKAVHEKLGPGRAATAGWIAGQRTGDYLLAHRIPRAVQLLLKALPAPLASRILLRAIARHSWTFAGSARVRFAAGNPTKVEMSGSPLCRHIVADRPSCAFYAATFERLFRALVHGAAVAAETTCAAKGDRACTFEIGWPGRNAS